MSSIRSLFIALPVAAATVLLAAGCTNPVLAPVPTAPVAATPVATPSATPTVAAVQAQTLAHLDCDHLIPLAAIQGKFGSDVVPSTPTPLADSNGAWVHLDQISSADGLACAWANGPDVHASGYEGALVLVLTNATASWSAARPEMLGSDDGQEMGTPETHFGDESFQDCGFPDEKPFPFCHDNVLVNSFWISIELSGVNHDGVLLAPTDPIVQAATDAVGALAHS
ncbi:MAG: hypothetical protein ABJA94_11775 [Rhodoglobus sp.]